MADKIDYYDIKRVSATSLSWFDKSPLYFKSMFDKEIEEGEKFMYIKGDKIHKYILEPEEYKYLILDYETPKSKQQLNFCKKYASYKKGKDSEKLIKAYKDSYITKDGTNEEKILEGANKLKRQFKEYIKYLKLVHSYDFILSSKEATWLSKIKENLSDHKKAFKLLYDDKHYELLNNKFAKNEFEIYWERHNVKCKSKLDRLVIDYENKIIYLIDLKTSADIYNFINNSFEKYKYYRQMAFYWYAIEYYISNELKLNFNDFEHKTYIITIDTKELSEIVVFEISEKIIQKGKLEVDKKLKQLKWHFDNNTWKYPRDYYDGDGSIIIK